MQKQRLTDGRRHPRRRPSPLAKALTAQGPPPARAGRPSEGHHMERCGSRYGRPQHPRGRPPPLAGGMGNTGYETCRGQATPTEDAALPHMRTRSLPAAPLQPRSTPPPTSPCARDTCMTRIAGPSMLFQMTTLMQSRWYSSGAAWLRGARVTGSAASLWQTWATRARWRAPGASCRWRGRARWRGAAAAPVPGAVPSSPSRAAPPRAPRPPSASRPACSQRLRL